MTRRIVSPKALLLAGLLCAAPALAAQDDPAKVKRDLFSVLALKGKPCDQVRRYERQGEDDYLVECANGRKYRVRIQGERVRVEDR
jgi:hypothetical protein